VTNSSAVDASFAWTFLEDEEVCRAQATTRRPYIPVNQVPIYYDVC
jgi:hypothetical protein